MSKPKHPRKLGDNEAQALVSNMRVSPRKLNLVAALIRNKKASAAVATLTFSKRRIATEVRKALESAIANAIGAWRKSLRTARSWMNARMLLSRANRVCRNGKYSTTIPNRSPPSMPRAARR